MIGLLAALFIFSLLVFVHELGHFIAAKKAGIKVEEFGLGYPPRIKGFKIETSPGSYSIKTGNEWCLERIWPKT